MPLQQMIEQNSYDANDDLTTSHELANDLRELYDLPMISKEEENKDLMSSDIIINLNGFLKDYTPNSEENPVDAIKTCRENIS
jgi:hypothetical protein